MSKFTELLKRALSHGWMVSDITDEQVDLYHTCTHGEHAGEQQSITITRTGDIWLDD